jgi:phosphatidylglycerophosphate synthase
MRTPIHKLRAFFYPCTVVDYLRIALLASAAWATVLWHETSPAFWLQSLVLLLVVLSLLLDLLDGYLARRLGHVTKMGAVLDMGIDLTTHTFVWSLSESHWVWLPILLEWSAGLYVTFSGLQTNAHWKSTMTTQGPLLLQIYFGHRQRNMLSALANISHTLFPVMVYVSLLPRWVHLLALPGVLVYEIVTAYMLYVSIRSRVTTAKPTGRPQGQIAIPRRMPNEKTR